MLKLWVILKNPLQFGEQRHNYEKVIQFICVKR